MPRLWTRLADLGIDLIVALAQVLAWVQSAMRRRPRGHGPPVHLGTM